MQFNNQMTIEQISPGNPASSEDYFGTPITVYTRQQALEDGFLVDITPDAKEAGFNISVCVTRVVWEDCCAWTEDDDKKSRYSQNQDGRIWNVVWAASLAARDPQHKGRNQATYWIRRVPRTGIGDRNKVVTLKMVIASEYQGEPCLTIMQPHED